MSKCKHCGGLTQSGVDLHPACSDGWVYAQLAKHLDDKVMAQKGRIAELEQQLRQATEWRPYPETEPDEYGRYLVRYKSGHKTATFIADWDCGSGDFEGWTNTVRGTDITHFMELPPPPEAGK